MTVKQRLRIARRVAAMAALLPVCVLLFMAWNATTRRRVGTRHNPWPRQFLRAVARIAGARVQVVGSPLQNGAFLLANHVSWLDIPVLAGASGTAFVAHSGLMQSRLLAWLCAMNDTVFVARHDRRSVHAQVEQVREALSEMGALAIFPEGTTSDGTGLLTFKSSLLSSLDPPPPGVAVQPVWIDYGTDPRAIAWVGEEPGLANFLRILARSKPLPVTLHFLEPFDPAQAGNRKAIAARAQAAITSAMQRDASRAAGRAD